MAKNNYINDDIQFFTFVLKRWQLVTAIMATIIYMSSWPILIARLSQDVNAKADKELVQQHFNSIDNSLTLINTTLQKLVDLHIKK